MASPDKAREVVEAVFELMQRCIGELARLPVETLDVATLEAKARDMAARESTVEPEARG